MEERNGMRIRSVLTCGVGIILADNVKEKA